MLHTGLNFHYNNILYSYLRGLVPVYNSVVKSDLLEPLRAKADGKTTLSMKNEFSKVTLQVTSQVRHLVVIFHLKRTLVTVSMLEKSHS